jgi:hypothetical protein
MVPGEHLAQLLVLQRQATAQRARESWGGDHQHHRHEHRHRNNLDNALHRATSSILHALRQ